MNAALARQQAQKRRWFLALGAGVLLWLAVAWFVEPLFRWLGSFPA